MIKAKKYTYLGVAQRPIFGGKMLVQKGDSFIIREDDLDKMSFARQFIPPAWKVDSVKLQPEDKPMKPKVDEPKKIKLDIKDSPLKKKVQPSKTLIGSKTLTPKANKKGK